MIEARLARGKLLLPLPAPIVDFGLCGDATAVVFRLMLVLRFVGEYGGSETCWLERKIGTGGASDGICVKTVRSGRVLKGLLRPGDANGDKDVTREEMEDDAWVDEEDRDDDDDEEEAGSVDIARTKALIGCSGDCGRVRSIKGADATGVERGERTGISGGINNTGVDDEIEDSEDVEEDVGEERDDGDEVDEASVEMVATTGLISCSVYQASRAVCN
jgi:hypothetical protein